MSELSNSGLDFGSDPGEDLDIAAIFGGGGATDANPFAQPEPTPAQSTQTQTAREATSPQPEATESALTQPEPDNPIEAAFAARESVEAKIPAPAPQSDGPQLSLFDRPPIFSYGGAKEPIADASQTFEELRIAKAEDFPELSEGKKVSWYVEYGKVNKSIMDPKGATIASIKEEIERSKAFLDGLKKDKNKNPDCLVKPRVTAQSKGIAAYKGVFQTLEEAEASDKVICLVPARDGQVYEMRQTELGRFIAPKNNVVEFSEVRAGFIPALPPIPCELMDQIIAFFQYFMRGESEYEALVHLYWDREQREFVVNIPKQHVSKDRIDVDLTERMLPEERYLHYADIHSHNSMKAVFSDLDDRDEQAITA